LNTKTDELKKMEEEILDGVRQCNHCKMCATVCPTNEGWFSQSSMGRIAAIYAYFVYGMGTDEELSKLLYQCSTCRRCQNLCKALSAGTENADIIIKMRQYLAKKNEKEGKK